MKTIAELPRNSVEKVVISAGTFKGTERIDIRLYYLPNTAQPTQWFPTRKGLSLPLVTWPEFRDLIMQADKALDPNTDKALDPPAGLNHEHEFQISESGQQTLSL